MMVRWWFLCLFPAMISAQFSPGKLSKYHAHLEGNSSCIQCHDLGKKEISDGCNVCHTPLKKRIDAKLGFHKDKTDECGSCHSDHNGTKFELVYWPKDIRKFNHEKTGYTLTGKHDVVECGECHSRKNITWEPIRQWASEHTQFPVLDRTFLGLSATCNSCHEDIHTDQVTSDCASCHNTSDWKLAIQDFDHNQAKFLLTGAHKRVDCEKCHPAQPDHPKKVWKLTGMAYDNCSRCHTDIHKGSYGETCESCHTTEDWKKDLKPFDHSKTKYPLAGKHINVSCNECHQTTLAGGLPRYLSCIGCHEDKHYAQFENRRDGGDCAACHTVNGFLPATFTGSMHQMIRFPLDGAHLAVPCSGCHKPVQPVQGKTTVQFTWKDMNCAVCHDDVHRKQFLKHDNKTCDSCHITEAFTRVKFDHEKTNYPLDGKHMNVNCQECHKKEQDQNGQFVRYAPVPHQCKDCHTFTEQIR